MSENTTYTAPDSYQDALSQYETYYTTPGILRETDAFYQWILTRLGARHGKLLDVACGEGYMIAWAQRRGLDSYGIDFSETAIRTAGKISQGGAVLVGNGELLPFETGSFDFVTNLGSLEHFVRPDQGLREMKRVLHRDGRIGILVPNSYYLLDIVWHVWRRGYPVSHSQTIERFATAGQWTDLIRQNGLQILEAHKYNLCLPRSMYDLGWYRRAPLKLAFPMMSPLTPFNLAYSFLFICTHARA